MAAAIAQLALKPPPVVVCVTTTTTKIDLLFHSSTTKPNYNLIPSSKFFFNNSQPPRNYENLAAVGNFTRKGRRRRRIVTCSVSGLWDAITGGGGDSTREALLTIRRGMQLFREGNVLESVVEFDKAIQLDPRQKAYLWQRGLSLYYLDRFEEGAEQFRIDVAQNPNDTEESIWCFLCEAQLYGVDEARKKFLEVGRDPRPVMREAYNLFKDGGDPEKLVKAFQSGRESDYFYASLYAGLYHESQGKADGAKRHIVAACESPYGQRSDDYMASLAKVHKQCRNWSP